VDSGFIRWNLSYRLDQEQREELARRVARAIREAVEAEREACALVAQAVADKATLMRQTNDGGPHGGDFVQGQEDAADRIEMAIRERAALKAVESES
jgi:nitrate/TMAO reductase-like tetraheme cytochrome c subunit